MNYSKIYYSIINKRKETIPTGYVEKHHITPKCLGGNDTPDNLVYLTAREHFICHLLLTKMVDKNSQNYYKICHAFLMMLLSGKDHSRHITSRSFEHLRIHANKNISNSMKRIQAGENNSQYGTYWIYNINTKECKKHIGTIPDGWNYGRIINFSFVDDSCIMCGVNLQKIKNDKQKYCLNCKKKTKRPNSKKRCSINGVIYQSVKEAAIAHNILPNTLQYRIKSENYPTYFYLK